MCFDIKFFVVVYGYDRDMKVYKVPVKYIFIYPKFEMLNPSPIIVDDITRELMTSKPAVFSRVLKYPHEYIVDHILPPEVYPCNEACMQIADVVKRYKTVNRLSNSMTINVNVIEKSEIA